MTAFRVAVKTDDALLRALLRENGFPGWVEMSMEREPSFFAGAGIVGEDWAVIASEDDTVVGMYTASVLPVYVDGTPEKVGYLGGLRVNGPHRRRIRHLRGGYASIRGLSRASTTRPWWFTSISAANHTARRLLESGVRGLPKYHSLGRYVTLALPAARGRARGLWRRTAEPDVQRIADFHNSCARGFQLSPSLSASVIRRIGTDNFFYFEKGGAIQGVAALWDQRQFKQIVARGYRAPIRGVLPAYNVLAKFLRRPTLPRVGQRLEHTFMAFLALGEVAMEDARDLVQELLHYCATPILTLGLHASSPVLRVLESLAPLRYDSCVYAVSFDSAPALSALPVQPEAALL